MTGDALGNETRQRMWIYFNGYLLGDYSKLEHHSIWLRDIVHGDSRYLIYRVVRRLLRERARVYPRDCHIQDQAQTYDPQRIYPKYMFKSGR